MSLNRFRIVAIAAAVLLSACESGSGSDPQTTPGEVTSITSSTSTMVVNLGASGSATITVLKTAGFVAPVALSVEGLPNGVTSTFSTPVLTFGQTTSTLNLVTVQNAIPGTYPLVVRATASGTPSKTTTLTLTIPAPTFNIAATTAATTIALEQSLAVQVTSTRTGGGFVDPATLSATGLPAGVTATFAPAVLNDTVTTSTMTLTPALGTALGPMTVGVRATALGVVTMAPPLQLAIVDAAQPTYRVLTALPILGVLRGGASGQMTISTPRAGGLITPVALSLEGAPAGTVATFIPNNSTGTSSLLDISVPAATPAGNVTVTVRGTTPSLPDRTATFTLQVLQAPGVLITANPATLTVARGQTQSFFLTTQSLGGYSGSYTITYDQLPAGITVGGAFGVTRTMSSGQISTGAIDVIVAATCPPGTYALVFTLSATGGFVSAATLTVVVTN